MDNAVPVTPQVLPPFMANYAIEDIGQIPLGGAGPRDMREALGHGTARLTRAEHIQRAITVVRTRLDRCASQLANKWRGKTLIVVGSGPSVKHSVEDLRQRIERDRDNVCVMTLNKTHDFLVNGVPKPGRRNRWITRPIVPEFAMLIDPKDWCAEYITPHPKPLYLLGTGVSPVVWAKMDAYRAHGVRPYWFYPCYDEQVDPVTGMNDVDEIIQATGTNTICMIAGGSNVGLRAFAMAGMLGFETVELWGYDSCYGPGSLPREGAFKTSELYAFEKPHIEHNSGDFTIKSRRDGSRFVAIANEAMRRQIVQFAGIVKQIEQINSTAMPMNNIHAWGAYWNGENLHKNSWRRMKIRVAGDGAIPWLAWKDGGPDRVIEHTDPARMEAKYGRSRIWDYCSDCETTDAELLAMRIRAKRAFDAVMEAKGFNLGVMRKSEAEYRAERDMARAEAEARKKLLGAA